GDLGTGVIPAGAAGTGGNLAAGRGVRAWPEAHVGSGRVHHPAALGSAEAARTHAGAGRGLVSSRAADVDIGGRAGIGHTGGRVGSGRSRLGQAGQVGAAA
ncbi:MAG: hypothetical protein ACRCYU_04495, partial [Nocardioides sp.]